MFDSFITLLKDNWIVFCIAAFFLTVLYTVTEISRRAEMKREAQEKERKLAEGTKDETSKGA